MDRGMTDRVGAQMSSRLPSGMCRRCAHGTIMHCMSGRNDVSLLSAQSSNPAASPHTLGAGFVRGHPIFTSMILPHNIVYHPTNHPKDNW